jgi:hypothetical protein
VGVEAAGNAAHDRAAVDSGELRLAGTAPGPWVRVTFAGD